MTILSWPKTSLKRADVNHRDNSENPLFLAVSLEDLDLVKLYVTNGAEINIKDKKNNSPLSLAKKAENQEIFNYLQSKKSLLKYWKQED